MRVVFLSIRFLISFVSVLFFSQSKSSYVIAPYYFIFLSVKCRCCFFIVLLNQHKDTSKETGQISTFLHFWYLCIKK